MTQDASASRASASKVAKWLVDKGRVDDAVSLLSAWAAAGPNDADGQKLLAGALRINPASPLAKAAFARMEGLDGEFGDLDAAVQKWTASEIARLEREMAQPSFNRAQVGFNNNLKYREHVYHIQTEDSGLNKPHIITHLFADGGRVIKSHKRVYADQVSRPDIALYVRGLMKGQHMEMIIALRDGRFDEVIEGRAMGGMDTLTEPPNVDVKQIKKKKAEGAPSSASPKELAVKVQGQAPRPPSPSKPQMPAVTPPKPPPVPPMRKPAPSEELHQPVPLVRPAEAEAVPLVRPPRVRFRLHVLRSLAGGPDIYEPAADEVVLGAKGAIALPGERFCHPSEAIFRWKGGGLAIEDFEGGNGVFLRVRRPVEVEPGDEFIIGDQLLRIEKNPVADDEPSPDPTYFYSSPKWPSAFRVVQIFEGGAPGACVVARGTTLQVGSAVGDLVFPNDPLVSEQHCYIEEQAGSIVLTDLQSRTGVFVRVKGEERLDHGDQIIVGRTRLAVDLSPSGLG
ncbi:MAG TPA: FHA domain-containing protein [Polyangiaceae bacterium]|nr:FHA domain-containing protein [Polyangiaceae bacterium]